MPLQQTIKKAVSLEGVGLHTGERSTVTFNPAPDGYGVRVVRVDLPDSPEIPADIDYVVDLARGTAIGKGDVKVHSLEHTMAALAGLGIDNCRIEVDANEIPIMDGSALPFVKALKDADVVQQNEKREYITVDSPIDYVDGDLALGIYPSDHFRATVMIDYRHPALGVQYTTLFSIDDFVKDFAPARTFCFLSEIEKLREKGLIKGGALDSALVVQDVDLSEDHIAYIKKLFDEQSLKQGTNGFLNNTKTRFPNEPCRHKLVDLMGDLYLLGKPIRAHIFASRPGHAANHELAKKIRKVITKTKKSKATTIKAPMSYEDILGILPHRYPFLLVDGVEKIVPEKSIVAYKNVTFNDNFFQGHFPGNPVMPGVLEIEAMAQAGGLMALHGKKVGKDKTILFMGVDKARFRDVVRPGDKLRIELEMLQNRRGIIRFAGKCFVGERLTCEAEMMAMLQKKEKSPEEK